MREMGDWLRDKMGSGVVVLGAVISDRPLLISMVTPDLRPSGLDASQIVRRALRSSEEEEEDGPIPRRRGTRCNQAWRRAESRAQPRRRADRPRLRILALDVGDRRIGVAVSDPLGVLASPLTAIERRSDADSIEAILEVLIREEAGQIVVGLPITLRGGHSAQTNAVAAFVRKLENSVPGPCDYCGREVFYRRGRRTLPVPDREITERGRIERCAAGVILQTYLDSRSST